MVSTVLTPQTKDLHLIIEPEYIGKEIEIKYYSLDEINIDTISKSKTMSKFKGILTSAEADELNKYVNESREEWG